ncbi:2OG-Fe(II) oxygenase [Alishewanella sp. SMS8]|uniref:2OG-Fe(II) oxygenase n=1 Tax=Alishewanella sp. SMS8 TaxID=2994676 RepID=UPI0027414763|nr:2OG-Fe(II) oxygenase [Alishewanella sp. SMS8]MDP5460068.1 2OG-Fe(II) oxygenase [Alishewanella sp. SMS8]
MWLNNALITDTAVRAFRKQLIHSSPKHLVLDDLFDTAKLHNVLAALQHASNWQMQQHTYSALYVDSSTWQKTNAQQRFVQRDLWQRPEQNDPSDIAQQFLLFLRSSEFLALLSRLFKVALTDINVANPAINTNYFRLSANDFVKQHADDSPGRELCMLLYLNQDWHEQDGGELVFMGTHQQPIAISPQFNRCVLFDPASPGAEHWVKPVSCSSKQVFRYNVTSWYWSE